jgi:hypothetical protein
MCRRGPFLSEFLVQGDGQNYTREIGVHRQRLPKSIAKARKPRKQRKPSVEHHSVTVPGGDGWQNVPKEVTFDPALWVAFFKQQLWAIAKAGKADGAPTLRRNSFKMDPLPHVLYYAVLRKLLERGRQVDISYKHGQWRKRTLVETELEAIEELCGFQNFNKDTGYENTRVATKKGVTFYNIIIGIECVHTQKLQRNANSEFAEFKVIVASLNPLANTMFPKEFEQTATNIAVLQRYLRSFPIRMHRAGYEVSPELRGICKQIAKSQRGGTTGRA